MSSRRQVGSSTLGADLVGQPTLSATCSAGKGDRLIDYFVVANWLRPSTFGTGVLLENQLGTHKAITAMFSRSTISNLADTIRASKPIPDTDGISIGYLWAESIDKALDTITAEWPKQHCIPAMQQHLDDHPWPEGLMLLDVAFAVWTRAGELWKQSRSGILEKDWSLYLGRWQLCQAKETMKKPKLIQPELYVIGQLFWASLTQRFIEWNIVPSVELQGWFGDQAVEIAQVSGLCLAADKTERDAWQLTLASIKWAPDDQVSYLQQAARAQKHL